MATYYQGIEGTVKFNATGATAVEVTEVTAWTMNIKKEILTTTQYGDVSQRNVGGLIYASGSVDLLYTGNNNTFIEAINTSGDTGAALFELYLHEATNKRIVFNGIIDSASYGNNRDDVVTISCTFVSTGNITLEI